MILREGTTPHFDPEARPRYPTLILKANTTPHLDPEGTVVEQALIEDCKEGVEDGAVGLEDLVNESHLKPGQRVSNERARVVRIEGRQGLGPQDSDCGGQGKGVQNGTCLENGTNEGIRERRDKAQVKSEER